MGPERVSLEEFFEQVRELFWQLENHDVLDGLDENVAALIRKLLPRIRAEIEICALQSLRMPYDVEIGYARVRVVPIDLPQRPIYLIGHGGVGKSSVASLLARESGRKHFDQDDAFRTRHGWIPDLLKTHDWSWIAPRLLTMLDHVGPHDIVSVSAGCLVSEEAGDSRDRYVQQLRKGLVVLLLPTNDHEKNIEILFERESLPSQGHTSDLAVTQRRYWERIEAFKKIAHCTVYGGSSPEATALAVHETLGKHRMHRAVERVPLPRFLGQLRDILWQIERLPVVPVQLHDAAARLMPQVERLTTIVPDETVVFGTRNRIKIG